MSINQPSDGTAVVNRAKTHASMASIVTAGIIAITAVHGAAISAAAGPVSGTLTVDGKKIVPAYACVDRTDPDEPIIVISNKPLPADAVPFIPEKLLKQQGIYAVAFSVSRKDKKLTNTYGMLSSPGNASQVGLGRVEEGKVKLTIGRLDDDVIEGRITTIKPVSLPYISYSFDLTFRIGPAKVK
jgi:hypothetical protein